MRYGNDEHTYDDHLDHFPMVAQVGKMITECRPPYVVGVCGPWGCGKTSFLRKLSAYLGGTFEVPEKDGTERKRPMTDKERKEQRADWFGSNYTQVPESVKNWHVIWFNAWHHQFEPSPLVALLQEIRRHFSFQTKAKHEAAKLADVSTHTALNMLPEFAKLIQIPWNVSPKAIMERGQAYEAENYSAAVASQRFRDFFEAAIKELIKPEGRLVIFIDDLDRCEGEVAFRLLESLKLYLNAGNCVYVLGLDQAHLETAIARIFAGSKDAAVCLPQARDYLGKMFQSRFILPMSDNVRPLIETILEEDPNLKGLLEERFGLERGGWDTVLDTLDGNLPHNPRKIKAFLSAWRVYLRLLESTRPRTTMFDWRLTAILCYLAQFEETLYRAVEVSPGFYTQEILRFCETGSSSHFSLSGLGIPAASFNMAMDTGDLVRPDDPSETETTGGASGDNTGTVEPRHFWIAPLVEEVRAVDPDVVRKHLLGVRIS